MLQDNIVSLHEKKREHPTKSLYHASYIGVIIHQIDTQSNIKNCQKISKKSTSAVNRHLFLSVTNQFL